MSHDVANAVSRRDDRTCSAHVTSNRLAAEDVGTGGLPAP